MADKARFAVSLTSTLDLPELARRLSAAELKILRDGGDSIVKKIKGRWVGWKYESAPKDKRGRSRAGWKRTLTSNTDPITLTISNDARDYYKGDPYVEHVARKKGDTPEYVLAFEDVLSNDIPKLRDALTAAILAAMNEPAPARRVRPNRESETVSATLT
jgi:hypothetical protein